MANHSSILAWITPWTEEPGGLWGQGESDTTEHTSNKNDHQDTERSYHPKPSLEIPLKSHPHLNPSPDKYLSLLISVDLSFHALSTITQPVTLDTGLFHSSQCL